MRILMSLLVAAFFLGGQAVAGECVCDGQSGAAYGLCIAYCEAMDCDGDMPNADDTACAKIEDCYKQITGDVPPWIDECPCFTYNHVCDMIKEAPSANVDWEYVQFDAALHGAKITSLPADAGFAYADYDDGSHTRCAISSHGVGGSIGPLLGYGLTAVKSCMAILDDAAQTCMP